MDSQNTHDFSHATVPTPSQLALSLQLLMRCSEPMELKERCQQAITFLVEQVPQASHGGMMVKEPTGHLSLRAYHPIDDPVVSLTAANKAMEQQEVILWKPNEGGEINISGLTSGVYLPCMWADNVTGVLYLHSDNTGSALTLDDLDMPLAVAHYLALASAYHDLETRLQHTLQLVSNFERLVGPHASSLLHHRKGRIRLGGDFVEVTVVSADIRGFTKLSAKMSPDDVTDMLEDYFGHLVPVVSHHGGYVDNFIGDQILAVFEGETQYLDAIVAALGMQNAMDQVNTQRTQQDQHIGQLGIGIHSGEIVRGFVGSTQRMVYTVIGDVVNRACRYSDGAGPAEVLISPEVFGHVAGRVHTEAANISTKHEGNWIAYRVKGIKLM
jgi:adenylate cyclase